MNANAPLGSASAGPIFDMLAKFLRVLCSGVLVLLVLLICAEAFLRGTINYSLGFAEELTGYGVVFLTLFGAAVALREGVLFQVHFLLEKWPEGMRRWLMRGFTVLAFIVCVILAWKTKDIMLSSFARGKFAPTVLKTPLWIPQVILPFGFGFMAVFLIEQFILTFRNSKENT